MFEVLTRFRLALRLGNQARAPPEAEILVLRQRPLAVNGMPSARLAVHSQNSNSNVLMMESLENQQWDDSTAATIHLGYGCD
jgi:hypothetical protein